MMINKITGLNVERTHKYRATFRIVWKFNTPYSSHMGWAWERLVGVSRRIIDSLLVNVRHTKLTLEVLTTFFGRGLCHS